MKQQISTVRWESVKLGDISTIKGRIGWRGYTRDDLRERGPLVIGATQISSSNKLDLTKPVFISEDKYYESPEIMLQKGDILIVKVGNTIGKVAIINKDIGRATLNPNCVVLKKIKINHYFLYYYLLTDYAQHYLKSYSTASAQPAINQSTIAEMEIHLPPLPVQQKIAAILTAYDDLIENYSRRIQILEDMAQAIYREWFVYFRFPDHENVRMFDSGTELGMMPEGWEVRIIEDALVLQRGFDLPTQDRQDGDVPIYAATGITGTHNIAKVKAPGVVTGRSGSLGTVMYVDKDFWPLNTTLWIKEFRRVTPIFAYYFLNGMALEQYNSGAAVPTLNRNDIHGMPVIIPPHQLLLDFDDVVLPIYSLKGNIDRKNVNIQIARNMLLPKLISGELDMSKVDIPVD
jgi:type I restriction enzyme S subunit